ncbi:PREDICTED: seed trypsin/chymotrypsin inhibitor IVB-like isoform X2 [Nelumbo nucifera]|uniref:Seed trypsin/chymotrypsin inhibitor IVB-like isoform X2 n=1 Tax=Nelumbo nucifera TaxID=4432 RepID=A0A1U7ZTE2_NELNU|nr:PREDICTED: seed trypsin/chymotrypsin inhibitor IVB-like isoform X2 [Nelumbo nucifera]
MGVKVVAVVVIAAVVAICAGGADGRVDMSSFLGSVGIQVGDKTSSEACCDTCYCTKSNPPICRCADIKEYCHSACKQCICALSYPPQCRCVDTNNFCYDPCTTTNKNQHLLNVLF